MAQEVYRTPEAAAVFEKMYDEALAALPYECERKGVPTSFGAAHVLVAGPPDAPPLLMWQGTAVPAPFSLLMFPRLAHHFRVYAPDTPGQAGSRSDPADLDRPPGGHGYGRWALEVVRGLGLLPEQPPPGGAGSAGGRPAADGSTASLAPVHVGISLGGSICLDLATVAPEAIRAAALLVPGSLHPAYGAWSSLLRVLAALLLPMALYTLWPCAWTGRLALASMCDEPTEEDPTIRQVLAAVRHVRRFPGAPPKFSREDLAGLAVPTLVVAARDDIFGPGEATAARARAVLPNCEAVVTEGKHMGGRAKDAEAEGMVLDFFRRKGVMGGG